MAHTLLRRSQQRPEHEKNVRVVCGVDLFSFFKAAVDSFELLH
jgi:hypothetical protein